MNKDNKSKNFSRRDFIRKIGIGTAAVASTSLLGGFTFKRFSNVQNHLDFLDTYAQQKINYILPLNKNWLFGGEFFEDASRPDFNDENFTKVILPHCVNKLSWQNWNPLDWEKQWIYRRHFTIPQNFKGMRVFINFEGVMVSTTAVINGHVLPTHPGGYLPFRFEITDWLKENDNIIAVEVDSRWSNTPPEGSPKGARRIDYLEAGGIIRSVYLQVLPNVYINDVFAKPEKVLDERRRINVVCKIDAGKDAAKSLKLKAELRNGKNVISKTEKTLNITKNSQTEVNLVLNKLGNIKLWDLQNPKLYDVAVTLYDGENPVHIYNVRTGLRHVHFELDGFFLNGKRTQLFGLNRHEIYPYVGFAMPSRVMHRDAEILKHELNCNAVRCSHYPQNEAFINACDELGLLVWEEVPGWGYLGDEAWKNLLVKDVHDMIIRDRNHPSIIIWGVRVNESPNDPVLYRKTKEVAKSLDDSRPTSGSMTPKSIKTWKEDWHQDVLAFDDYHADKIGSVGIIEPPPGVPYMLAEAVGQFNYDNPKKGFSSIYRRTGDIETQMKQAIRHAQAHDKAAANKRISGVIAWCGFEYGSLMNSYKHVKYPGVADFFRVPKIGASFYQAQVNPLKRVVIQPNFYWDFGINSPYGPGKNAVIFSNCERLELFIDGKHYKSLSPDFVNYKHLKYPPFMVNLEIKEGKYPELRIDGYIENKLVLSKSFSSDPSQDKFYMDIDDKNLIGDGSDATRLVFKVADKFEQPRPFAGGEVTFIIKGPGVIIGDNPFLLSESGGVGAIWIKTLPNSSGDIKIKATHSILGSKTGTITVHAEDNS